MLVNVLLLHVILIYVRPVHILINVAAAIVYSLDSYQVQSVYV